MNKDYKKIINESNSKKFRQLQFFLSFLVVFIHSYTYYYNEDNVQWVIQKIISDNIGRVAVPLFYVISGFFLFLKYDNSFEDYKILISKKVRSLVIPYFFWSLITFCLMYCIQSVYTDFNQELIRNKSFCENILSIIKGENTILWFVRIMFFMNLLAPLIKFVIDRAVLYIPIIIILLILDFSNNNVDSFLFKTDSLLFFMLGGLLSQNIHLINENLNYKILLVTSVIFAFGNIYTDYGTTIGVNTVNIFERLFIFSFSLFLWNYQSIYKLITKIPAKYYNYSFTIYIFHAHIMVLIIKKSFSFFISLPIAVYLLTALTTFFLSLYLSIFLEKHLPGFYRILSGGRKNKVGKV